MDTRPKIKIELSKTDKALEVFCLILLILLWLGTAGGYSKLPDQIPIHFNAKGYADAYGAKFKIFILPIIASILYVAISIINRNPHLYNYPSTITPDNAKRLYTTATKLIRVLKCIVIFIFTMIVAMTYRSALSPDSGLGRLFLPVCIVLMLFPTIFFLSKGRDKGSASK